MALLKLVSDYEPTGDQPQAIEKLVKGVSSGIKNQVLLGVTGSGKTFTIANVINKTQRPTLVISHNKTLAAQLYQEFREFFPNSAVSYFVSYYDYYQPEAYIPQSNTYIEKEADINEVIDKLRLRATSNILSRRDVIVVASVSCIYNIGKPQQYLENTLSLKIGMDIDRKSLYRGLVGLQYSQSQFEFKRGTFRDRGNSVDINLSYEDTALRIDFEYNKIKRLSLINPLIGRTIKIIKEYTVYAAKLYIAGGSGLDSVFSEIMHDLEYEAGNFERHGRAIEAERLRKRVMHDIELIGEVGYVNGIENYSRYFDNRKPGDPPYSLLDYFQYSYGNDWLLVVDESHMTIPQIRGMYRGDKSRKANLVEYGFRLKAAFDNRPLTFEEFRKKIHQTIYMSATPSDWEIQKSTQIVEQLVRPTGIPDPMISVRPVKAQIDNLIFECEKRVKKKQRVLVTTLTKRIAEDLSEYLKERGIRAHYLHSDVKTLDRSDTLDKLRKGQYDVLIGVNLLREGLDLPEVTLVAILDADREGFLRSKTAFIQIMGRAARNQEGEVIIYTDKMTTALSGAIAEVERRRSYQIKYNKIHNITPKTIHKPLRERLILEDDIVELTGVSDIRGGYKSGDLSEIVAKGLTKYDVKRLISSLKRQMKKEADNLNFELAAAIRDKVHELESEHLR